MMEGWQKLKKTPGIGLLAALLLAGLSLLALSYLMPTGQPRERAEDLSYVASPLEKRLASVLSEIDGVGQVSVLIHTKDEEGQVVGVLVVAQGAEQLTVRTELMRAAMTLLDVPASSVEVFAMQETAGEGVNHA